MKLEARRGDESLDLVAMVIGERKFPVRWGWGSAGLRRLHLQSSYSG